MAMPIIPKALYPLVPNAPGVPAMLRNVAKVADAATLGFLGISDALDLLIGAEQAQWGVFTKAGSPVAIADSVLGFDYRNGSKVSDYPVEQGAFASYNKVADPYEVRIRMVRAGSERERTDFIFALEAAAASLDTFEVRTPEISYLNANIDGFDYRRETTNGAGVIIAEIHLREIREVAAAAFSSPKSPSAADPQSQGQVQTESVPENIVTVTRIR
jgi:hypothetical protein